MCEGLLRQSVCLHSQSPPQKLCVDDESLDSLVLVRTGVAINEGASQPRRSSGTVLKSQKTHRARSRVEWRSQNIGKVLQLPEKSSSDGSVSALLAGGHTLLFHCHVPNIFKFIGLEVAMLCLYSWNLFFFFLNIEMRLISVWRGRRRVLHWEWDRWLKKRDVNHYADWGISREKKHWADDIRDWVLVRMTRPLGQSGEAESHVCSICQETYFFPFYQIKIIVNIFTSQSHALRAADIFMRAMRMIVRVTRPIEPYRC